MQTTKEIFRKYNLSLLHKIVGNVEFEFNQKFLPQNEDYEKPLKN